MSRPGRVAEAADVRVAQRLLDALGHLPPRHPLAAVDAGLHPVELGEDVVGEVEPAVGEDVALDPAQDAERRQHLVGGRDLLGLAADVVGREAADGADRRRVVADREVLVAALARGAAHLLDARPPVRPGRVAVQVAADVGRRSTSAGGSPRNGASRSSGGHHGRPSARVHGRLVGRVRAAARAPRRTRPSRSRARSAVPNRSGVGGDELDRHALDRHARPRAARACSITATICGSAANRVEHGAGSGAAQTTARCSQESRQRRTSPADLAAERGRDRRRRAPSARLRSRPRAVAARPRGRAPRAAAPRSSARSPARRAAARPPPPRAARRRCARRAPARSRSSASRSSPR